MTKEPLPGLRDEILLVHLARAEEELGPIVKPRQDYRTIYFLSICIELYPEQFFPRRHKRRHLFLLEHVGSVSLHCAGKHLCGRVCTSLFYLRELLANNTFWDLRSHESIERL
jgi:hypothetical protein